MMKMLFIGLALLMGVFLFLFGKGMDRSSELPVFLQEDEIAQDHETVIDVRVKALKHPSSSQLEGFKTDYAAVWAHLNHLYQTNDIAAGKEYYTEDWFRNLAAGNTKKVSNGIHRKDLFHQVYLMNWSSDGLACTAIDSAAVLQYTLPQAGNKFTLATVAFTFLYQGDHWRIDAVRFIEENEIITSKKLR